MSLAARCPWCETVFRLTEGQISAKGGMARCGVCGHTFNALDALLSDSAVAALENSAKPSSDTAPLDAPTQPLPLAENSAGTLGDERGVHESLAATDPLGAQQEPSLASQPFTELRMPLREEPNSALAREREGPNTFTPSFLESTEPTMRRSGLGLVLWSVLCLLACLALAGQTIYWWRSEIAWRLPAARPVLFSACQKLKCVILPPAQIDQLSIESSELVALPANPGTLSFSALVRNRSSSAQRYPAVELTLTDARDQALIRRVFEPREYLPQDRWSHLADGIAANSELPIKLTFDTSGVATTGYRAGVFYP